MPNTNIWDFVDHVIRNNFDYHVSGVRLDHAETYPSQEDNYTGCVFMCNYFNFQVLTKEFSFTSINLVFRNNNLVDSNYNINAFENRHLEYQDYNHFEEEILMLKIEIANKFDNWIIER